MLMMTMVPSSGRRCLSLLLLSMMMISTTVNAAGGAVAAAVEDDKDEEFLDNCPLWMAESHTSTKNKLVYGLFAGRNYKKDEEFPDFSELAIPLIDFVLQHNRDTPKHDMIVEFVENHLWTSEFGGSFWEANSSSPIQVPGVGTLSNYHSCISNVDFIQASILLRDRESFPGKEPGKPHPSRGAITPYYNATIKATRDIPAGMELFADFGDVWDGNFTDDAFQDKLNRFDYEEADKIVDGLIEFFDDVDLDNLDLKQDILDFVLNEVLLVNAGKHAKILKTLIPENPKKLKAVKNAGGTFMYRYYDYVHSNAWLREYGICMASIKAGISTIPDAGRGAFSTKTIEKDDIITVSPMLHIADKDLLNIYPWETDASGKTVYNRNAAPIGKQLLLNYCFGHPESSLVLYPLGPLTTLINHSKEPNAFITWSKKNRHEYGDVSVDFMAGVSEVVISMKVVAMRKIEPGEEILLDYGPEWEEAWQDYKIKWDMTTELNPTHPLKAEDVREMYKNKPMETTETLKENPYPRDVIPACFLNSADREDGLTKMSPETGRRINQWINPVNLTDYKGKTMFVVDIIERKETHDKWFYNYTLESLSTAGGNRLEQIVDVPHQACTFVDAPYKGDIHMKSAFRHPIGIKDTRFPQAWRDLRGK